VSFSTCSDRKLKEFGLVEHLHSSSDSTQDGTITTSLSLDIYKYCTVPISQSNYVEIDDAL
jgi:hypothetical protein